jgi:branched-chain amino acid transport system substrate-binding protein
MDPMSLRGSYFLRLIMGYLGLVLAVVADSGPDGQGVEPFMELRSQTLGYHGSDLEYTNLAEIRIGWFGPYDTNGAADGDMWWAASRAVEEANSRGGLRGLPFRLIPRWSVDPWGTGVSQLARMVFEDQPLAILGGVDSASTHLAEQVVAKANLPLVSPITSDKSVTLAGVSWIFSCAPSGDAIAKSLAAEILRSVQQKPGRVAMISTTDHESRMVAREVARACARSGHGIDFRVDMPPKTADFTHALDTFPGSDLAGVIIVAGAEDAAKAVLAVRSLWPTVSIWGGPSMGLTRFVQVAGARAEGVQFPMILDPEVATERLTQFETAFVAVRHRSPDFSAIMTYDAARLLLEALLEAGPSRVRTREILARAGTWEGIGGRIDFDGTGQNKRANVRMGTVRGGKVVPLRS